MSPFFSVAHGKFVFMYVFSFLYCLCDKSFVSSRRCSIGGQLLMFVVTMYKILKSRPPKKETTSIIYTPSFILNMYHFLLRSKKEDILKNVGNQTICRQLTPIV